MQLGDVQVLGISLSSFIVFIVIQLIIYRTVNPQRILHAILISAGTTGFLGLTIGLLLIHSPLQELLLILFLSGYIYGILVVLYVFGIFILVESSITLRLLYEIGRKYPNPISRMNITKKYSFNFIVKRRLERLVYLGEVIQTGKGYSLSDKHSYFSVRSILAWINDIIFPPLQR